MKKCYDCTHVEMCGWRKEVKEQGCEFFGDGIGWIPCSERLPKECDGCVLVSKEDGEVTTGLHSEFSDLWYIGDMCGVGGCKVIAWMPLPDPYYEDGEV